MRFLLLCPVALLLLTAPAQTIPTDSVEVSNDSTTTEPASSELTDSGPSPATTTTTSAPEVESVSPSTEPPTKSTSVKPDQPDPKELRRLRRRLAKGKAELTALKEENKILEATLISAKSKMSQLMDKRLALATQLTTAKRKLREAQDKLNSKDLQEGQCKLSEAELAKLVEEETSRQLEKRKAEVELSYENQYEKLLKELRLKVRKELLLLSDAPKINPRPFFLTPKSKG